MFVQPAPASLHGRPDRRRRRRWLALSILVADLLATLAMRRRGYPLGGNVVVRCRRGHLFTTIWVPLASLKSVRLGWWRFQRCPVGAHWSLVTPVKGSDLSRRQRRRAHAHKDVRIP
jgi:hypothetical protein